MLEVGNIRAKVPKHFVMPNMIMLAGAGRNVGKTSFAVAVIEHLKKLGHIVYGLKIAPHFHTSNPPYLLVQTDNYKIYLEKDFSATKDSSRMLKAGADEVFFVRANTDSALPIAFDFVRRMANKNVLWVCESGSLRSFVDPGLFLYFKLKGQIPQKSSAIKRMPLADKIVEFNGVDFDFAVENIGVENYKFEIVK